MRSKGPLTFTSCFPFENFYSELRNSYVAGTQSPLKQILSKCLLKRSIINHNCTSPIYLSNHDTALECNSIVYTRDLNETHIYSIQDIADDGSLMCYPVGKHEFKFMTENINWNSVGVFKIGSISNDLVNVQRKCMRKSTKN